MVCSEYADNDKKVLEIALRKLHPRLKPFVPLRFVYKYVRGFPHSQPAASTTEAPHPYTHFIPASSSHFKTPKRLTSNVVEVIVPIP